MRSIVLTLTVAVAVLALGVMVLWDGEDPLSTDVETDWSLSSALRSRLRIVAETFRELSKANLPTDEDEGASPGAGGAARILCTELRSLFFTMLGFFRELVVANLPEDEEGEEQAEGGGGEALLAQLLQTQVRLEAARPKVVNARIMVGINTCLDLVVRALPLLQWAEAQLFLDPDNLTPQSHDQLSDYQSLCECALWAMERGAAAERHFGDVERYAALVEEASSQTTAQSSVGGNAALLAARFGALGARVELAGPVGPELRRLLPDQVTVLAATAAVTATATASDADAYDLSRDQVHLIMEYERGARFHQVESPRANRFILTNDLANADLAGLAPLFSALRRDPLRADSLVLSGLHMLESHQSAQRDRLLTACVDGIEEWLLRRSDALAATAEAPRDADTLVHLELASMASCSLWQAILARVAWRMHSLGVNEQELASAYSALGGDPKLFGAEAAERAAHRSLPPTRDAARAGLPEARLPAAYWPPATLRRPTPAQLAAAAVHVLHTLHQHGRGDAHARLRRLHVHSLAFHLVAQIEPANAHVQEPTLAAWRRQEGVPAPPQWTEADRVADAVAAGAFSASAQACGEADTGRLDVEQLELHMPKHFDVPTSAEGTRRLTLRGERAVYHWVYEGATGLPDVHFWLSPVLVCKHPERTVGLGDCITATAIARSVYLH